MKGDDIAEVPCSRWGEAEGRDSGVAEERREKPGTSVRRDKIQRGESIREAGNHPGFADRIHGRENKTAAVGRRKAAQRTVSLPPAARMRRPEKPGSGPAS